MNAAERVGSSDTQTRLRHSLFWQNSCSLSLKGSSIVSSLCLSTMSLYWRWLSPKQETELQLLKKHQSQRQWLFVFGERGATSVVFCLRHYKIISLVSTHDSENCGNFLSDDNKNTCHNYDIISCDYMSLYHIIIQLFIITAHRRLLWRQLCVIVTVPSCMKFSDL